MKSQNCIISHAAVIAGWALKPHQQRTKSLENLLAGGHLTEAMPVSNVRCKRWTMKSGNFILKSPLAGSQHMDNPGSRNTEC